MIIVVAVVVVAVVVGLLLAYPFGDGGGDGLPEVAVEAPGNGAIVKDTVTVSGTADASDGEVAKVQVRIGSEGGWKRADGTTSWSYEWDTSARQDGRVAVSVRSYDGSNYSRVVTMVYDVNNVGDVVEMSVQEFVTAARGNIDDQEMKMQSSINGVKPDDVLQVSGTISGLKYHNASEFPLIGEYTTVLLPYNATLPPRQFHVVGNVTGFSEGDIVIVTLHVLNVSGSFPDLTNTTWQLSGEFLMEQFIFIEQFDSPFLAYDSGKFDIILMSYQIAKA